MYSLTRSWGMSAESSAMFFNVIAWLASLSWRSVGASFKMNSLSSWIVVPLRAPSIVPIAVRVCDILNI